MTDRELMQMALDALEYDGALKHKQAAFALRERLSQPEYEFECPRCGHCCQQREWVGLTDGDIADVLKEYEGRMWIDGFRAIEAKLKEKNT